MQLITELINYHRKQRDFFEGGKRKRHYKKQAAYSESSSSTKSEYDLPKKRKTKKKTKKYKDTFFFDCTKIVFFTTSYCLLHCQQILWYKYTLSYMYIEE